MFTLNVDRPQTLPLKTSISGVNDGHTISTANVFETTNASPIFKVAVRSTFTHTDAYQGVSGAVDLTPTALYYEVDGGSHWAIALPEDGGRTDATGFRLHLGAQSIGPHALYVYPVYGAASPSLSSNVALYFNGSFPETGNLAAYSFQIDPLL